LVDDLIDAVARTRDFPRWRRLVGREDIFPVLEERFPTLDAKVRKYVVEVAARVGTDPRMRQKRWLFSQGVAGFLVRVIARDPDRDVRNWAADLLVDHVPDAYLRRWAKEIVAAAKRHSTDRDILLLGKTGAAEARQLLLNDEKFRKTSATSCDLALAKLGDTKRSEQFVQAFNKAKDPERKAALARRLGYVGDAACVMALARQMRSPMMVPTGGVVKPLRVEIAEALSAVYPENPVFWIPYAKRPSDDSWYEGMERWLNGYLGVTWDQPRPPFAFTHSLPIPEPPRE